MLDSRRENEAERLDALHQLNLLDTSPSEAFDRITRMAAQIFNLPVAAVSLTDSDRQWFKSRVGIEHWSIPRHKAPCAQVVETADLLVVPDLLADDCYRNSVLAEQGVRFYAGAALVTREGHGLGAMCVLGTEPREATEAELASLKDLAAMVMSQIELQHALGRIDPLSGMPNRTQFIEDLEDQAREHPGARRVAVLLDLAPPDRLSNGLRVLGPKFVDDIVRETLPILRRAVRPAIVYHVAGTQFALVGERTEEAFERAKRIEARLSAIRKGQHLGLLTPAAVGVMPFTLGEVSPTDILRSAYGAALDARSAGTAISLHSPSSEVTHRRRFDLLRDFERALAAGDQLRLVAQPRVSLADGSCAGVEFLLRWEHPSLGAVSPAEFIPIVEQSTLARPMTAWVLERATAALADWRAAGLELKGSVNISAANLEEADLVQRVQLSLLRHDLPTSALEIEVTESAAMRADGLAMQQLALFSEVGSSWPWTISGPAIAAWPISARFRRARSRSIAPSSKTSSKTLRPARCCARWSPCSATSVGMWSPRASKTQTWRPCSWRWGATKRRASCSRGRWSSTPSPPSCQRPP
jgi:GGDEF domain-containing protein